MNALIIYIPQEGNKNYKGGGKLGKLGKLG